MLLKTSVIVGSLVAGAMANPLAQVLGRNGNFCGAPVVTEEQRRADREIMALAGESLVAAADVVVPTYFHVIAQSKTESGGYLSVSLFFFIILIIDHIYTCLFILIYIIIVNPN